jgi:hypothetical protein
MVAALFWIILFSLVLLLVVPDRPQAKREIAKREAKRRVRGTLL